MALTPAQQNALDRLTREARRFGRTFPNRTEVTDSFGQFADHPLAALNRRRLKAILETIARVPSKNRHLRVADLACGTGLLAQALTLLGSVRCVGVDADAAAVQTAREFGALVRPRAGLEEGDAPVFLSADLSDPEVSWETVLGEALGGRPEIAVLPHALHRLDPRFVPSVLHRLHRWLDSGAVLVINEENPWSPSWRAAHWRRTSRRPFSHWKGLLEEAGFEVGRPQALEPTPLAGPVLERALPWLAWSLVFTARRS